MMYILSVSHKNVKIDRKNRTIFRNKELVLGSGSGLDLVLFE